MLPYKNTTGTRYLKINGLSGGTNYQDRPENIHDTQLADSKNVWFKNGVLKTRPSIFMGKNNALIMRNDEEVERKVILDKKNTTLIRDETFFLEVTLTVPYARTESQINMRYVSAQNDLPLGGFVLPLSNVTVLPVQYKGDIFLYLHGYSDKNESVSRIYTVKRLDEGVYEEIRQVLEEELYVPLVLTNCWPSFGDSGKVNSVLLKGATQVEGFNLLGNRYKMQFSTFDNSPMGYRIYYDSENPENSLSYMEYSLPYTVNGCTGDITVEYTDIKGKVHYHRVRCPSLNEPTVEEGENEDGAYLHAALKGGVCHIYFREGRSSESDLLVVSSFEYVNNNMTVTAPCKNSAENLKKVCRMTQAAWYGNNSLGISGGSRLFFCGGQDSLVLWSDFENPLYFPENNYAYVGDKTQRTTAFGKQGSSLIIFKENEIYSTQYVQGDVSAEELMDQSVIDITTPLAYFPMTLIHPHIGCDCPESIQLLRNRLVFASSDGAVYVITGQNQFSERNVYEVSELIRPKLLEEELKNASSADWNGNYILFVKNRAYIMDYNSYGYVNISSFNRDEAGNRLIPWYVWEFNESIVGSAAAEGKLLIWTEKAGEKYFAIQPFFMDGREKNDERLILSESGSVERGIEKIPSLILTKHFDFQDPHRIKVIEKVMLELDREGLTGISFITEGRVPDTRTVQASSFVPMNRYTKRLGVLIRAEDRFTLNDLTVLFRHGSNI